MNKVVLVTNEENIKNTIISNLVLLRESDIVLCTNYAEAPDEVYSLKPNIVIIHEHDNRDKTINLIKYFKEKRVFENTNIILLLNKYDRDFILNAYDEGIDDYYTVSSDASEMLIRTINCIKKSEKSKEIKNLKFYLSNYGIISEISGFYSPKFTKEVFETELINKDYNNCSFMIISPDEDGKKEFSGAKMVSAIKSATRNSDVIGEALGSRYYLLLNTTTAGAGVVYNKIKEELPENFTIKAGIAEITTKKFAEIEKKATCALNEALLNNREYVIYVYANDEISQDDWLVENKPQEKTFKFFKSVFNKKLENVIAPVFYRLQKTYEERLINTKIEQFTDEKQSVFRLINGGNESRLQIVYPGFSKTIIYITHSGLESPENREMTLPINKINSKEVSNIVEGFINESIDYINKVRI